MTKDQTNIRIPEPIKQRLEQWATKEGRSLSNLLNRIILKALHEEKAK